MDLAETFVDGSEVYRELGTTLVPAIVRVRALRWAGKRQIVEGVTWQLKDLFGLERHRAKTLGGMLTRLATRVAAYTCGRVLNFRLGRPLRHLADLLI